MTPCYSEINGHVGMLQRGNWLPSALAPSEPLLQADTARYGGGGGVEFYLGVPQYQREQGFPGQWRLIDMPESLI